MPSWWRALAVVIDPAVTPAALNATYDGLLARRVVYADGDPLEAVVQAWDPERYDEILVATLPVDGVWESSQLELLLSQIRYHTGGSVTHLVCDPIAAESLEPSPRTTRASGKRVTSLSRNHGNRGRGTR